MPRVTYCRRWNPVLKTPLGVMSEEQAVRLHRKRKPYSVAIEAGNRSVVFIEMCFFQAYCHVSVMDERKRVARRYSFVEAEHGRLFMEERASHYYSGASDRATHAEFFRFRQDGSVTHDVAQADGSAIRSEGRTDTSIHYVAAPDFGEFDTLLEYDRLEGGRSGRRP